MLDSDAELSDSAACLTLACSATVVSPSIVLALQTAHGRQGTGVLHTGIRESLGPRARASAFDAACVCAHVSMHSLRKERGQPGWRQRGTYSRIGARPATESAALLRMHAAATRMCVVRPLHPHDMRPCWHV